MRAAGRRAARDKNKKAASPLAYEWLPRSRRVSPCPAHRQTPGTIDELAFDSQKRKRNYKNPLTGSVHTSRGLPTHRATWLNGK
jgi:hypothetical protein